MSAKISIVQEWTLTGRCGCPSHSCAKPCAHSLALHRLREQATVTIPYTEHYKNNVCDESVPAVPLDKSVPGSTTKSYFKLEGLSTPRWRETVSLLMKNLTEYSPVWPRAEAANPRRPRKTLPAREGYLFNGVKSDEQDAKDLVQINVCMERAVKFQSCFVTDDNKPVKLGAVAVKYFDLDHGEGQGSGPEVIQFKCPGGTFSLFGTERGDRDGVNEDADLGDFMLHVSDNAKSKERDTEGQKTANGLDVHTYDCPGDEWVTLWSSNAETEPPRSSELSREAERSAVMINYTNVDCMDVIFGVLPIEYKMEDPLGDKKKIESTLRQSLELSPTNYPGLTEGECTHEEHGRNFMFAGVRNPPATGGTDDDGGAGGDEENCPPPPRPVTIRADPMFVVNGKTRHFWLPDGKMVPLMAWSANSSSQALVLSGETFGHGVGQPSQARDRLQPPPPPRALALFGDSVRQPSPPCAPNLPAVVRLVHAHGGRERGASGDHLQEAAQARALGRRQAGGRGGQGGAVEAPSRSVGEGLLAARAEYWRKRAC